jgi:hypothetical protein
MLSAFSNITNLESSSNSIEKVVTVFDSSRATVFKLDVNYI